jgi:hypothetical protein
MATLSDEELRALTDAAYTQMIIDEAQAINARQNNYQWGSGTLTAGSHEILFNAEHTLVFTEGFSVATPYEITETPHFTIKEAIDGDGFDIGCTISNLTINGFTVAVDADCTFFFETVYRKTWYSD